MIEIWKPIKDYKNYQVSNFGNIKSLNYNHTGKEQILKPCKDNKGYLQVNLWKNGKKKLFKVHRLVATMFLENPENKPCVNHLDCNPSNNNVNNLEWCTYSENTQYASKLGRMKGAEYLKNVSTEQRRMNGKKAGCKPIIVTNLTTGETIQFESIRETARQLGLDRKSIIKVLKGRFRQTGGYTFKYVDNK